MRDRGYTHVRTSALSTAALRALEPHGFAVCQRLALLTSTLDPTRESMSRPVDFSNTFDNDFSLQSTSLTRLRMRRADLGRVLDVDESAFGRRWSLDEPGLCDAVSATPRARVFVARSRAIDGYVVVGATNSAHPSNGFVQRLAVHASAQRNGLGKALLRSALQWLTTRGCKTVYVNTEQTNEVALSLYQQHGFRAVPHELCVLECNLNERKA
jgi:ribosomal protein S18 acetylase RimI-like enzyme